MKHLFNHFLLLTLLLAVGISFIACDDDPIEPSPTPSPSETTITGAWKFTDDEGAYNIFIFEKDGSYREIAYGTSGNCCEDAKGSYHYDANRKTLRMTANYSGMVQDITCTVSSFETENGLIFSYENRTFTLQWFTEPIPDYPAAEQSNIWSVEGAWCRHFDSDKEDVLIFDKDGTLAQRGLSVAGHGVKLS
jgi:hypothetical protein